MADSPTTTNQTATDADKVIHGLIFDVAVQAAEAEIISAVPLMGAPVIKQIDEEILKLVAEKIYQKLALGVNFVIIDSQTGAEAASANAAREELKKAINGGDADAISQATKDFMASFGKLVHADGSATP